jgi:hypothetical protein
MDVVKVLTVQIASGGHEIRLPGGEGARDATGTRRILRSSP